MIKFIIKLYDDNPEIDLLNIVNDFIPKKVQRLVNFNISSVEFEPWNGWR